MIEEKKKQLDAVREVWDVVVSNTCNWLCRKFPDRHRVIPAESGDRDLLEQFMIVPNHLYLQHFRSPESSDLFHNHRWSYMRSLILSGEYVEERALTKPVPGQPIQSYFVLRSRGQTHKMNKDDVHRVDYWSDDCWTLFFMGKNNKSWGYFQAVDGAYTEWKDKIQKRIENLETKTFTE